MSNSEGAERPSRTRRDFLKDAGAATALMASGNYAFAQGSDVIKVGLIGCGGRGTGAASDALHADAGAKLVAMADVFQAHIDSSLAGLKTQPELAARVQVDKDHQFVGLDAYLHLLDSGVDVAIVASPPGFHPQHIKGAAAAGKHIFAEKPMGTDVAGVKSALEAVKANAARGKTFVSGFCYRYASTHRSFYGRLRDGAIGPVRSVHATYITGQVKPMPPASARPAGMSDVEWQIRNWYNFVWLCGDGLIEQACHSIDKILWAMNDVPPLRAVGTGGRIFPNNEGNIFDHIDVFYEWPDGVRATMAQRQMPDLPCNDNTDYVTGSKGYGTVHFASAEMKGDVEWRADPPPKSMYVREHEALFSAIRKGKQINDAEKMARSTLAGLMGRMAAYTGACVTWEQIMNSNEDLFPKDLRWDGALPIAPMAVPGKTPLV
jgi:predicted dehydrogenase